LKEDVQEAGETCNPCLRKADLACHSTVR
jgi:hypothetical protein